METYDEIKATIAEDGKILTFDNGLLDAIMGTSTSLLRQEPSFAEVEQTEINFYASTKDCIDLEVAAQQLCTMDDDVYIYTLKILRNPIPFMDSWSRIPACYVSREEK